MNRYPGITEEEESKVFGAKLKEVIFGTIISQWERIMKTVICLP